MRHSFHWVPHSTGLPTSRCLRRPVGYAVTSSAFDQQMRALVRQAMKDSFAQAKCKALFTFGSVVLAFVGLAGAAAFYLTPSHMQLGFFGSLKEYLDESADLASIFLFSCLLSNLMFYKCIADVVYQNKQANGRPKLIFRLWRLFWREVHILSLFVFHALLCFALCSYHFGFSKSNLP